MTHHAKRTVPLVKILPNVITIFGICVGLTALRSALNGEVATALYLLVLAMVLDALDGKIARLTKSESQIGIELDTLADFFNFGIATPLIIFFTVFAPSNYPNIGWLAILCLSICCAFRLARFNTSLNTEEAKLAGSNDFVGVPAPALASLSLTPLYLMNLGVDVPEHFSFVTVLFILLCGSLAVATFPTFSLKGFAIPVGRQYTAILAVTTFVACLWVFPWVTLLVVNTAYLVTLPLYARHRKRQEQLTRTMTEGQNVDAQKNSDQAL